MDRKPTYKELERKVKELEQEVFEHKRATEQLRIFSSVFEQSSNSIAILDIKGRVEYANPKLCELYEIDPDEVIGKNWRSFLSAFSSLSENFPEIRNTVLEKGMMWRGEITDRTKSDEEILREAVIFPIKNEKDQIIRSVYMSEDITKRKRGEEALRESEEKFRNIINSSPMGIHMYKLDEEGRLIFTGANPAADTILGIDNKRFIGKTIQEAFPPLVNTEVPERYRLACKKGEPWHTEQIDYEDEQIKGAFEVYAFQTAPDMMATLFVDISERKKTEVALRESEEKYREFANSLPQYVFEMDENAVITFANRNAFDFFEYTQNDFDKGINALQILIPEDRDRAMENIQRGLSGEKFGGSEYIAQKKDGTTFPVVIHVNPIIRENKPVGLRGIIIDITDRKLAEEEKRNLEKQLVQAQKMEAIGTLAGGIAHDFNNILMSIIGYSEIMDLLEVPEDNHIKPHLKEVLKAANRAKALVQQILTFSRQTEYEKKPLQLSSIVKEALKFLRASLPSTVAIQQNIESGTGTVLADPTQLHQVIMNLCTNAGHAMREQGGVLEVNLTEVDLDGESVAQFPDLDPGAYLRLTVRDTGHGIDHDIIGRIFDPFFTTKERGEGTGMGLSVVHGIVHDHGGAITVESEPGEGNTFQVFLSLIKKETEEIKAVKLSPLQKGNETILLVDDEKVIVDLGEKTLQHLGYNVIGKTSSKEALDIFRSQPDHFDMVITDMTMPNMTGVDLAEKLLQIRSDIPIILCTGFSYKVTPEKAQSIGIREFINKPLSPRELAESVRRVLDKSIKE